MVQEDQVELQTTSVEVVEDLTGIVQQFIMVVMVVEGVTYKIVDQLIPI